MLLRRKKKRKENTSKAINNVVTPVTLRCTGEMDMDVLGVCLWTRARATFFHRSHFVSFVCECVHAAGSCGRGGKCVSLFGVHLCGTVSWVAAKPPWPRCPRTEKISLNGFIKTRLFNHLDFCIVTKTARHRCTSRAASQEWSHPDLVNKSHFS